MDRDREAGQSTIIDFYKRTPRANLPIPSTDETNPSTSQPEPFVDPTRLPPQPREDTETKQRKNLRGIAAETIRLCSQLDPTLAYYAAASTSYTLEKLTRLDPALCPGHNPTPIKIVNRDSLTAAIELGQLHNATFAKTAQELPLVMNFANRHQRGGGWLNGAVAQEEAICYRSTLSLSLEKARYPLSPKEALYNPTVVVLREESARGHGVIPEAKRPIVAAVTVAALQSPKVTTFGMADGTGKVVFASEQDRKWTKDKMRLTLRIAAAHGHELLVLGAFGCGAFRNPPEDVAWCWREVLGEHEFSGGWWKEVWFAIYDPSHTTDPKGNLATFQRVLNGLEF
jgi:uncharacterized protein (TIGR02452 family)